jgi:methylglyoxal synthase
MHEIPRIDPRGEGFAVALVAHDAVVFLRDPLTAHPHEPDIQALLKVCDVYGVPVATNVAAARILLSYLAIALEGRDSPEEPKAS